MADNPELNSPSPGKEGGINIGADKVDIGGDVVGRDKTTGNIVNVHVENSQAIKKGFDAFDTLMKRSSEMRVVATSFQFQGEFLAAREQIDRMADYKHLHDILHRVHFQCYRLIIEEVHRFPDETTLLEHYQIELEKLVIETQDLAARASIPALHISWVEKLDLANQKLIQALETLDEQPLKEAIWQLQRVLATQPGRINTLLVAAVDSLRLPELLTTLQDLADLLKKYASDAEEIQQFEDGVAALQDLQTRLAALVEDHHLWQDFETELQLIEGSNWELVDLSASWPSLKSMAAPFHQRSKNLFAECEKLEAALQANNPNQIKQSFRKYRHRVGVGFYRTDSNLLALCKTLRQVGRPLDGVMRYLH